MAGISNTSLAQPARDIARSLQNATPAQQAILGLSLLVGCYLVKRALESWTGTFFLAATFALGVGYLQLSYRQRTILPLYASQISPPTSPPSTLNAIPLRIRSFCPILFQNNVPNNDKSRPL